MYLQHIQGQLLKELMSVHLNQIYIYYLNRSCIYLGSMCDDPYNHSVLSLSVIIQFFSFLNSVTVLSLYDHNI